MEFEECIDEEIRTADEGIERPVSFCGKAENAGEVAIEIDVELAIGIGGQLDSIDQGSQQIGRLHPVLVCVGTLVSPSTCGR